MMPHMSAWTDATIARRARAMAANVDACVERRKLAHYVCLPGAGRQERKRES